MPPSPPGTTSAPPSPPSATWLEDKTRAAAGHTAANLTLLRGLVLVWWRKAHPQLSGPKFIERNQAQRRAQVFRAQFTSRKWKLLVADREFAAAVRRRQFNRACTVATRVFLEESVRRLRRR